MTAATSDAAGLHEVPCVPLANEPAAHGALQSAAVVDIVICEYVPFAQPTHAAAAAPAYEFLPHVRQSSAPEDAVPAAQAVHTRAPPAAALVDVEPAAHGVHCVAPDALVPRPRHELQLGGEERLSRNSPAGQGVHVMPSVVTPAAHCTHDRPSAEETSPDAHASQEGGTAVLVVGGLVGLARRALYADVARVGDERLVTLVAGV